MGKDYDVIIIGSGIGGITCGALLSNAGYKTLVLEKHYLLGGRASSYKKDGCIVDTFIHMVGETERGPLRDILKSSSLPFKLTVAIFLAFLNKAPLTSSVSMISLSRL